MASHILSDSLRVIYREAMRSPWILSALRSTSESDDATQPADSCDPVLVLGGLFSHPFYYAPLGHALERRGYPVHFDDGTFNTRPFRPHVADLCRRVEAIADATGSPVRIVGHSLGGLHAMALLADCPAAVGQVIAVASPVVGGTPWEPLERVAERILRIEASDSVELRARLAPFAERVTTVSAPQDLVAPPTSCAIEGACNVVLSTIPRRDESLASHAGVIFMRTVVQVVLSALEQPLVAFERASQAFVRRTVVGA
jgi:pimeloyl-ACP methyl ester carboxylesterase